MKAYNENDIQVLSDREHVRLRLPVYAGNTKSTWYEIPIFHQTEFSMKMLKFVPAVYKCIGEVIDNSLDEFAQINEPAKVLKIDANPQLAMYTISDNGRGVPIGIHSSGIPTPQVVFSSLRSGRNFTADKTTGVIGMNGMGASITCFCSTEFHVDIKRDKKRYRQMFSNGAEVVDKPNITRSTAPTTGTTISFQLDDSVFDDISLPSELMENRAVEIALANPGITVDYNGKKYKYPNGFIDIIKRISNDYFKFEMEGVEFFVIFDVNEGVDEKIFSWVNSSLLYDGGICNTQFLNAFYDKTTSHLSAAATRKKCEVSKNDVRRNLLVIGNLKLATPEYDAQSKTRLTGPNLRKELNDMIDSQWAVFARKKKAWLDTVLERAIMQYHDQENKNAVKKHQKNLKKKVSGLIDATSAFRGETMLLITEGLSASAQITQVRDPQIHGSFALTGKINNVYGATAAQLLKMPKIADLITAIGLVPGHRAHRSQLNFGWIVITTDADQDGADIFTLLTNMFYQFWPELFDPNEPPVIYRLLAPNVVASKGGTRKHFITRELYEKEKSKHKTWSIEYLKGLGSMCADDWLMVLNNGDSFLPITDDGNLKQTLELLFSPNSDNRKVWLQDEM